MLVVIVTATMFITQLMGPALTRLAVIKAGEAGLNVTDDDILEKGKAFDVMDENPPYIFEHMHINDILRIFSENDSLYYPVLPGSQ